MAEPAVSENVVELQPTRPGDYVIEWRHIRDDSQEEITARYAIRKTDGTAFAMVPLTANGYDAQSLLDNLKFWVDFMPSKDLTVGSKERELIVGDLLLAMAFISSVSAARIERKIILPGKAPAPQNDV